MLLDWIAFLVLFFVYLAFGAPAFVERLRAAASTWPRRVILVAGVLLPGTAVALWHLATGAEEVLDDLLGMMLLVTVVCILLRLRPSNAPPLHWTDLALVPVFWLPLEFFWMSDLRLHLLPEGRLRLSLLFAIDLALLVYLVLRPLPQVGYTFRLTAQDGRHILIALIAYGAVAIPLGSEMGFLAFSLAGGGLIDWLLRWPIIYFFTALPEELLFRGLLQNQLEGRFRNAQAALGITAVVFGLAHLNNPLPGFAVPNWTYALMAALAGIAYGWTWHRTHKVTASAIVHASVNFTWASFLSG
jgi:uncharacterized protein